MERSPAEERHRQRRLIGVADETHNTSEISSAVCSTCNSFSPASLPRRRRKTRASELQYYAHVWTLCASPGVICYLVSTGELVHCLQGCSCVPDDRIPMLSQPETFSEIHDEDDVEICADN